MYSDVPARREVVGKPDESACVDVMPAVDIGTSK